MEPAARRSGGVWEGMYRMVMRRTPVYITFVLVGAFLGERVCIFFSILVFYIFFYCCLFNCLYVCIFLDWIGSGDVIVLRVGIEEVGLFLICATTTFFLPVPCLSHIFVGLISFLYIICCFRVLISGCRSRRSCSLGSC